MSKYDRSRRSRSNNSRLRMDSYSSTSNGRSARGKSSPKRSELNNVMKKARQDSSKPSMYWNRKLLEAEERDPNRWRHSGYKELYAGGGEGSPGAVDRTNVRRTRSRSIQSRSQSRSKSRSYSPRQQRRLGPSSSRDRIRSPPPSRLSPTQRRSRERDRERERERDRERERERERARDVQRKERRSRPRRPQTPEPPPPKANVRRGESRTENRLDGRSKRRGSIPRPPSASGSSRSVSSCSDSDCSVCPLKSTKKRVSSPPLPSRRHSPPPRRVSPPLRRAPGPTSPSRRPAHSPPPRRAPANLSPPPSDPRRPPTSPPLVKRSSKAERRAKRERSKLKKRRAAAGLATIKLENAPRSHSPPMLNDSASDSGTSSSHSSIGAPRLTLSERFGRIAQWSENRRDLDGVRNMRITKDSESSDFKVVIEDDEEAPYRPLSPMPVSDRRVGIGYFPEALHSAPVGLEAWDDVRVRYQYYKDRGYLRDLTLADYISWEEWWYKYQEWLESERYYEQWHAMRGHMRTGRGRRKNRI